MGRLSVVIKSSFPAAFLFLTYCFRLQLPEGGAEKVVKSRHRPPFPSAADGRRGRNRQGGQRRGAGTAGRAGSGDFCWVSNGLENDMTLKFLFYNKTGHEIIFFQDYQEQIGNIREGHTRVIK